MLSNIPVVLFRHYKNYIPKRSNQGKLSIRFPLSLAEQSTHVTYNLYKKGRGF